MVSTLARGSLRRVVRAVRHRLRPYPIILMYHRVAEIDVDLWSCCVSPQHFAGHLRAIQAYGHPLQLQQLATALQNGNLPSRAVVVTFDDGYADNLHYAKPLLEHYQVPATVFVTTGQIGNTREFWWDELERMLLRPGRLPEQLQLMIDDRVYQWNLGAATVYTHDEYRRDHNRRAWEGVAGSRLAFFYSIWDVLRLAPHAARLRALDEIMVWAQAEEAARSSYRALSTDELRALANSESVTIGAHTVTHPSLPAHDRLQQRMEILQSKLDLENILNQPVKSFSYPFGDIVPQTSRLVQEARFVCACTTHGAIVERGSDLFQLPRFMVENWSEDQFATWLRTRL